MSTRGTGRCRVCGAEVRFVIVIGTLRRGEKRHHIPLDLVFDPAGPIAPSHALSPGRTRCRPITTDDPLTDAEHPALTHFATCPGPVARPIGT